MFSLKIGQVADVLKTQGAQLLLPVAALHAAAFFLGYQISKFSFGESTSRTISIECGMQVVIFLYFSAYQWTNLCSHPNTCLVFYSLWFHLSRTIFISSSWAPYITILRRIIWWVPNRVIVKIINHAKHYLVYVSIFRGGKFALSILFNDAKCARLVAFDERLGLVTYYWWMVMQGGNLAKARKIEWWRSEKRHHTSCYFL